MTKKLITRFAENINKINFNFFTLSLIIISVFGIYFLGSKGVTAGIVYSNMFYGGASLLFIVLFFLKDDDRLTPLTQYFKIPIARSLPLAVFFALMGVLVRLGMELFGRFANLNVATLSIPILATGGESSGGQSLSVFLIEQSMPVRLFLGGLTAGVQETLIYSFVAVLLCAILGLTVWSLITGIGKVDKKKSKTKIWFVRGFALIGSMLLFMGSHLLNDTYSGAQFFVAGAFILLSNISIFFGGIFLIFWIFWHITHNVLFFGQVYGLGAVITQGGWFTITSALLLIMMTLYAISNVGEIRRQLGSWLGWVQKGNWR